MAAVIPVPHVFSSAVDLPLQHASATVARAFAHALGQPLTQDKLRLMFTPDFGMFIAPGLYRHEKRTFLPFLVWTPVLFITGSAFVYYVMLPFSIEFFGSYHVDYHGGARYPHLVRTDAKQDLLSDILTKRMH